MLKSFEIYYGDLNEDAQKRLLALVGATDPAEMNWDPEINMCPLAIYETEVNTNE